MSTKTFTQIGTFSILILVPTTLLFTALFVSEFLNGQSNLIFEGSMLSIFLICALTFYRIKITVTEKYVSFKMGIGLMRKKYAVAEIESCEPVSNSMASGIGIRMLSNGWLYNVSGFRAVELKFKTKKSVVRIGTDRELDVSAAIQEVIELHTKK